MFLLAFFRRSTLYLLNFIRWGNADETWGTAEITWTDETR